MFMDGEMVMILQGERSGMFAPVSSSSDEFTSVYIDGEHLMYSNSALKRESETLFEEDDLHSAFDDEDEQDIIEDEEEFIQDQDRETVEFLKTSNLVDRFLGLPLRFQCKSNYILPQDPEERKALPVYSGGLHYFPKTFELLAKNGINILEYPKSLCAISKGSYEGHIQHYAVDEPLHWDRSRSSDNEDAFLRHYLEGELGPSIWRACAVCEIAICEDVESFTKDFDKEKEIEQDIELVFAITNKRWFSILKFLLKKYEHG